MDKIVLNKIWTKNYEPVVRAIYGDDIEFLNKYHQSAGQGLDIAVADTMANITKTSRFFKVETTLGALVGFFVMADPIDDKLVLEGFHIVKVFRTPKYLEAYWELVRQSFDSDFYTSVSENNIKAAAHLLKNSFQIVGPTEYNGKKFVIFKTVK